MSDLAFVTEDADVHLLVDGVAVRARAVLDEVVRFDVPAEAQTIRIASRSLVPKELGLSDDIRRLGVVVTRLVLTAPGVTADIAASHRALSDGWHAPEGAARWTDGAAELPPRVFRWVGQPFELALTLPRTQLRYPLGAPRALVAPSDRVSANTLRACAFEVVELPADAAFEPFLIGHGTRLDAIVLPPSGGDMPDAAMLGRHAPRAVILRADGAAPSSDAAGQAVAALPVAVPPRASAIPGAAARSGLAMLDMGDAAALRGFVADVMPFARILVPGLRLHVYRAAVALAEMEGDAVAFGDLPAAPGAVLDGHRILVVPATQAASRAALLAAGLAEGVPAIVPPDLAASLGLVHERDVLVADNATAFAMGIARLLGDAALWAQLSAAGQGWVAAHMSAGRALRRLTDIFVGAGRTDLVARMAAAQPSP